MASPKTVAANQQRRDRASAYAEQESRRIDQRTGRPRYVKVTVDNRGNVLRWLSVGGKPQAQREHR